MNHPFIKKFVEERELTVLLLVDASGSGRFGSAGPSKRELAAEIASVLAFSAIRNNDKVGLALFTRHVEKYIPPRKGRRHVLRVIREILFYEPQSAQTNLADALDFINRVITRRAIVVVLSDFLENAPRWQRRPAPTRPWLTALRQARRRHDVVCVQITDPNEFNLPDVGRLVLQDAETGEQAVVDTSDEHWRAVWQQQRRQQQAALEQTFRLARTDALQVRTDQPYEAALGRFFATREKRRLRG
jgi:uncharacterized protein (DUF58 family)